MAVNRIHDVKVLFKKQSFYNKISARMYKNAVCRVNTYIIIHYVIYTLWISEMKSKVIIVHPLRFSFTHPIKIYNSKSGAFVNEQVAGRGAPEKLY